MSATDLTQSDQRGAVASYLNLRRGIGIIGTALPFVLFVGNDILTHRVGTRGSVSGYYYTDMRNVFVGSMVATGVFLLCYHYERLDNILSGLGGACALGVAFFPTMPPDHPTSQEKLVGAFHVSFAAGFFLTLAYFCFFLFTRSNLPGTAQTDRKKLRNGIYRICGVVILICLVLCVVSTFLLPDSFVNDVHPLFYLESLAIISFGVGWFIKGETILKDIGGQ